MSEIYSDIPQAATWQLIRPITKGWSSDKKFYIETGDKAKLLLRISDLASYEHKKSEFAAMQQLVRGGVYMPQPLDCGLCNDGQNVYLLLTWLEGVDAETILPTLTDEEQYQFGYIAGQMLRAIHSLPAPHTQVPWKERFRRKTERKISSYQVCELQFSGSDRVIDYLHANMSLLKNRPQSFQHGDFHIGNMIINEHRQLGIIDFNRSDYGDPWEEFNRITFCAEISAPFASGRINGYFEDAVPDLFFRLLAFYIGSNLLSTLPWAIPFGPEEVATSLRQARNVLRWYDNFTTHIPSWYMAGALRLRNEEDK